MISLGEWLLRASFVFAVSLPGPAGPSAHGSRRASVCVCVCVRVFTLGERGFFFPCYAVSSLVWHVPRHAIGQAAGRIYTTVKSLSRSGIADETLRCPCEVSLLAHC